MPRYFIEVSYKGTAFSGFQSQENSITIQGEIERAFNIVLRTNLASTTSSRTDAGVHARHNFLHVDLDQLITEKNVYNINAVLHQDIVLLNMYLVPDQAHSRFDALTRHYKYYIHHVKNPFLHSVSFFHPLELNIDMMNQAATKILHQLDFTSFAKRHSDVNNFNCQIKQAVWTINDLNQLVFSVESNRFLRGMVRALVATQLLVGKGKVSLVEFESIMHAKDCTMADFSAPAHGLFLEKVYYEKELLSNPVMKS